MNKILKEAFIKLLLIGQVFFVFSPFTVKAQELLRILSLRISPGDDTAVIIWNTNYPATGFIEFGLTNGFGSWVGDNLLNQYHETVLSGLIPEKKYYFRLKATDVSGNAVISDIYNFTTINANDTEAPAITETAVSFATGNTLTFIWKTNEPADSCVNYNTVYSDLKYKKCDGNKTLIHDITVDKLLPNSLYYYSLTSKDGKGNAQTSVIQTTQTAYENDTNVPALVITEVAPFNQRVADDVYSADLIIKTNRPVSGYVKIGENPNSYNKQINISAPRSTETTVTFSELKQDKTYFYKLYLTDVLNKKLETQEYSFNTLPISILQNPGTLIKNNDSLNDPDNDFDQDGLNNAQETKYETDPVKSDTDGDGLVDGTEILRGSNPLDGIKQAIKEDVKAFAYGKARLKSLTQEQSLAKELKIKLEQSFGGKIPKSLQHWHILVNAYIYGGYPVEAIAQAIKWGGKTVHPLIPFSAWQHAADYKNYINR